MLACCAADSSHVFCITQRYEIVEIVKVHVEYTVYRLLSMPSHTNEFMVYMRGFFKKLCPIFYVPILSLKPLAK